MKWHEYIWLPKLKKHERQYIPVSQDKLRGGYTITNYTKADMDLLEKYYNRKIFWQRYFIKLN